MEIKHRRQHWQRISFKRSLYPLSGVNVILTPFVDVIFLLLIFFMIGGSLVFQPGITVDLPETQQEFKSVADKFIITYTREGLLFFNDQRLENWHQLDEKLAKIAYKRDADARANGLSGANPIIILRIDKEVVYNKVSNIMVVARSHGLSVFLATKTVQ